MPDRTSRATLDALLANLARALDDDTLHFYSSSPDGRRRYVVMDGSGRTPFGERARYAGDMADAMRFALHALTYERAGAPIQGIHY
jgi:hypothetical protein